MEIGLCQLRFSQFLLDRLRLVRLLGHKQSATCHALIDQLAPAS